MKPAARKADDRDLTAERLAELDALRREIEAATGTAPGSRWNLDPDDMQRSVVQLVLTLVEFVRRLLERQALRRFEEGSLDEAQVEDLGRALMLLEQTIDELAARFDLDRSQLNLQLGPLGKLM
jgi:gas vesicle protein GvpK